MDYSLNFATGFATWLPPTVVTSQVLFAGRLHFCRRGKTSNEIQIPLMLVSYVYGKLMPCTQQQVKTLNTIHLLPRYHTIINSLGTRSFFLSFLWLLNCPNTGDS